MHGLWARPARGARHQEPRGSTPRLYRGDWLAPGRRVRRRQSMGDDTHAVWHRCRSPHGKPPTVVCRARCDKNARWLCRWMSATNFRASALVYVRMGRITSNKMRSCETVRAGAFFSQADFQVPEKEMRHHTREDMVMPAWIYLTAAPWY